jgi:hypothetical protein
MSNISREATASLILSRTDDSIHHSADHAVAMLPPVISVSATAPAILRVALARYGGG